MTAPLLDRLVAVGAVIRRGDDGRLRLRSPLPLPPDLLAEVRARRDDLCAMVQDAEVAAAERAAIQAEPDLPAIGSVGRQRQDRIHLEQVRGLLRASRQRPSTWANTAFVPPLGCHCRTCGRFEPEKGGRWWRRRHEPDGWACMTCHPPDHLQPDEFICRRT